MAPVEVRISGVDSRGSVRLMVYADKETFLKQPIAKLETQVGPAGLAVFRIDHLEPGEYAFAAYHDENGDGKLNRNRIGIPKEAFAFSNGVVPRLRRPSFRRTKVLIEGPASVGFALGRVKSDEE